MIRRITQSDSSALNCFECPRWRMPWAEEVEGMVRALPHQLDTVQALGRFDEVGTLLAVAGWSTQPTPAGLLATVHVLAVRRGHRRKGLGREIKEAVLDECEIDGCIAAESTVAWGNDDMLDLNLDLGAHATLINPDFFRCIIPLPRKRPAAELDQLLE